MNDADQLETLRELLRDAVEVARSAASGASDSAAGDVFARAREGLATVLTGLDDFASRR